MKILFITLSNIGDVILTLPALDSLIAVYPRAQVTVLCGERATGLFEGNFYIKECIPYNKRATFLERVKFCLGLKKQGYELIVDFKNSALPLLLGARHKTYPWLNAPAGTLHMSKRHLFKVRPFVQPLYIRDKLEGKMASAGSLLSRKGLFISDSDRRSGIDLLSQANISSDEKFILLSPGARSHIKRWPEEKFAGLGDKLAGELKIKVVIAGDVSDTEVCHAVKARMSYAAADLCARTSLKCLAAIVEKASLVISNDSALMHLASYLDRPTLAVFGPTDYKKYGPWAIRSEVVHSRVECSPCETAQCVRGDLKCFHDIGVEEVYAAARKLL